MWKHLIKLTILLADKSDEWLTRYQHTQEIIKVNLP